MSFSSSLHDAFVALAICAFALMTSACGGHERKPSSLPSLQTELPIAQSPVEVSLNETLADLEKLKTPEGVAPDLFQQLKDELAKQLHINSASKIICRPPTGEANRVDDLALTDNSDGTYTLTWHYRNLGDYDQNGTVGISDITPIAMHYGETYDVEDVNCLLAVIDGSGNCIIDCADIMPIAEGFSSVVVGYKVRVADSSLAFENLGSVGFEAAEGAVIERRVCSHSFSAEAVGDGVLFQVVAYDSSGEFGEPSETLPFPFGPPLILDVQPREVYLDMGQVFTAIAVGGPYDEDGNLNFTEAWDMGEGVSPSKLKTATELGGSPVALVVGAKLGTYEASLSLRNQFGEHTYPFSYEVRESSSWVHSWRPGEWTDVDGAIWRPNGHLALIGYAKISHDYVAVEFTTAGELVSAKTLGIPAGVRIISLLTDSRGNIYIGGWTDAYGDVYGDIVVMKLDPDWNLVFAKALGGPATDHFSDLCVDSQENIYVTGQRTDCPFSHWDLYVLKLDKYGEVEFTEGWDKGGWMDGGRDIAVDEQGNIYISGSTGPLEGEGGGPLLLKFSLDGSLIFVKLYDGLAPGELVVSNTLYFRSGSTIGELTSDGDVVWAKNWVLPENVSFNKMRVLTPERFLLLGSHWESYDVLACSPPWRSVTSILLIQLKKDGTVSLAKKWGPPPPTYWWDAWTPVAADLLTDDSGNAYIAGSSQGRTGCWTDMSLTGDFTEIDLSAMNIQGEIKDLHLTETVLPDLEPSIPLEGEIDALPEPPDSHYRKSDFILLKNF
ncbi:SBBP repeat-containing protein [bacterium]|nr:SBBP repeat-containing protein [bacterium]